jgi:uncharacterized protein (DUF1778 family)
VDEGQVPQRRFTRRRRANVAGGREHAHRVRVSPQEHEVLVQRAEAQHVSVPRLLVESALSETGETPAQRQAAMVELFAVRRLLAAVSNNVNQVARHANAGEEFPQDAAAALTAVRRVVGRIDQAIDELSGTPSPSSARVGAGTRR